MFGPVISIVAFAFKVELVGLKIMIESVRRCPAVPVEGEDRRTVGVGRAEPVTVSAAEPLWDGAN